MRTKIRVCRKTFGQTLTTLLLLAGTLHAQINPDATPATRNLYKNLQAWAGKGVYFGHQDALAYGLNADGTRWIGDPNRSDVKTVTGQHPAVIGYDLGHLELDSTRNLDKVPFDRMKENMVKTYLRGGLNTVSWHPNNPVDPKKTTWDKEEFTIRKILNDAGRRENYLGWLDKLANFFLDLKAPDGQLVPVIFRPFHEHTGSWFWWGADHCTPEEYTAFWQLSVDHLLKTRKVNNLLIAYSTDVFRDRAHYLERYPGDGYADLIGMDTYHRNAPESNATFQAELRRMVEVLKSLSAEKGKPFAVTEMGLEQVTVPDWWTRVLLPVMGDSGATYFLVWRNGYDTHYYAPYEGHPSAEDFREMIRSGKVLLEDGIRKQTLYRP